MELFKKILLIAVVSYGTTWLIKKFAPASFQL